MSKTRYSVQSIAEILIAELGTLEASAVKIKEAVSQAERITLKIDDTASQAFQNSFLDHQNQLFNKQKAFLNNYNVVPIWIYVATIISWVITICSIYYGITQHQKVNQFINKTEITK